jgi:hypothetical protein
MEQKDLLVPEVADLLRLHPETVRAWLRQGRFPNAYRLSLRAGWRIPIDDIQALRHGGSSVPRQPVRQPFQIEVESVRLPDAAQRRAAPADTRLQHLANPDDVKALNLILESVGLDSWWTDFHGKSIDGRSVLTLFPPDTPCVFREGKVQMVDVDGSITGVPYGIVKPRSAEAMLIMVPSSCLNPRLHPGGCGCNDPFRI